MTAHLWNSIVFLWEQAANTSVFKGDRGIPVWSSPYHAADEPWLQVLHKVGLLEIFLNLYQVTQSLCLKELFLLQSEHHFQSTSIIYPYSNVLVFFLWILPKVTSVRTLPTNDIIVGSTVGFSQMPWAALKASLGACDLQVADWAHLNE